MRDDLDQALKTIEDYVDSVEVKHPKAADVMRERVRVLRADIEGVSKLIGSGGEAEAEE